MLKPKLFAESEHIQIAIYTWGEKPTIDQPREILVFAHGFPDRAVFWEKVAQATQVILIKIQEEYNCRQA